MNYPIVFWDSGGTIFHSADRAGGFGGTPSPDDVRKHRAFRARHALAMFGHEAPSDLPRVIDALQADLRAHHGARYSTELLAEALQAQAGSPRCKEESLFLADALDGLRYRAWLWDGVAEALGELHRAGTRMGVIADTHLTGRMMRRVLWGAGLGGFFDAVICSCDLGRQKPDPRVFQTALAKLAPLVSAPASVLYVGDNPEKDIAGAGAVGWDAALHLTGSETPRTDAVLAFTDYRDLVRLVLGHG